MKIEVIGIENFPIIKQGDNLAEIVYDTVKANGIEIQDDDVFVIAETVISKAEGNYVKIDDVKTTQKA